MSTLVSIIIPCRNEEKYISRCLDSIVSQDFSKEKLEVLVINGISEDRTKEIIKEYSRCFPYIKLLENPQKTTPYAMNIGIENAKGEIIMKMDAHTTYQKDYISKCQLYLNKYNADNVGGVLKAVPSENTLSAKAVALCLSDKFGMGSSYCKIGTKKIRWVDTVAFGCFRKEIFKKIGLYDEKMIRSQDLEFNLRLKKAGGKILLAPDIIGYYYPRPNLRAFLKQNLIDGSWISYPLKFGKVVFSLRHVIPLLFVLGLLGLIVLSFFFHLFLWLLVFVLGLYLLLSIFFSLKISIKEKDIRFLFLMPLVFTIRHFGYGFGSIWGLIKLFR